MSEKLDLTINEVAARLEIHPATTLAGMARGQLAAASKGEKEALRWYAARYMYPDCLACSTGEVGGQPVGKLTLDEFLNLPDQITEAWLDAVYRVNPHWSPRLPEPENQEEQEKKASMPSVG